MADVTLTTNGSLTTGDPPQNCKLCLAAAGEDLGAGMPCYIKSDGKAWKSTAVAADAAAEVHGWTVLAAKAGRPVTLFRDVSINYGSGLAVGTYLYLHATVAGTLQTVAPTNQTKPIALVLPDGVRIRVTGTW